MRRSSLAFTPVIPLFVALLAPLGCGESKGGGTETSGVTTETTQATQATQTMGSTTDDTASTVATTTSETTTTTTGPTTTGSTTTDPTTTGSTTGGDGQFCQEVCASDADCTILGSDAGYTCQNNRCIRDADTCSADADCVAILSGWALGCAAQADCPNQTYACIDIGGGVGRCAVRPGDGFTCADVLQGDVMADPIEGGAQIDVCGTTGGKCADGVCFEPCAADSDCTSQTGHPVCNTDTTRCECGTDGDCANSGIAGYGVCIAGVCGCGQDSDCALVSDRCFDGACGCSSVDACQTPQMFDGSTKICAGA